MQITHRTPRRVHAITGQPITHRAPHLTPRRLRNVGIASAVAVAVAGYVAIQTHGPDDQLTRPAAGIATTQTIPSSQATGEMRDTIAHLYGPATRTTQAIPSSQAMRGMRDTIAHLYGPATRTTQAIPSSQATREMRATIAHLYGGHR